jgi:hypothetical protein
VRYLGKVPGTDINQVGEAGCSFKFAVAQNGHMDMVRWLCELGAYINLMAGARGQEEIRP